MSKSRNLALGATILSALASPVAAEPLGLGHVAGCLDELGKLRVGDRAGGDPERGERDLVDRFLAVGVVAIAARVAHEEACCRQVDEFRVHDAACAAQSR